MDKTFKDYIKLIMNGTQSNESVLVEEFQNAEDEVYMNDVEQTGVDQGDWLDDEDLEEEVYDPNAMFDPGIEMVTIATVDQKKTLLIEYYSRLLEKIEVVRDHIDLISFDTVLSGDTIGITEIQFNLENLRDKIEKYISDQFVEDKYERALYLYLSFMEELKLLTKLLNRQIKTNTNQNK